MIGPDQLRRINSKPSPCCGAASWSKGEQRGVPIRQCTACGSRYRVGVRLPKSSGSGVVAGRITVGRGFRWGAGLV